MLNSKHITVVIPAYNEVQSIGRVIGDIPAQFDEIIVVDNGSSDQTGQVARMTGARVVNEARRGYGAACMAGVRAAGNTDIIAFIDGDYSDFPEDLLDVAGPVAREQTRFALGFRVSDPDSAALPWHQRVGNRFACLAIRLLYGIQFKDLGPMRCIERELLAGLEMTDTDYGWTTEMQLKVSRSGIQIAQVPVRCRRRIGQSKISGTLKGTVLAGYKILYWTVRLSVAGRKTGHAH